MSKYAIVTGASRGLGAACAEGLAMDGYDLIITYRENADKAAAVKADLENKYGVTVKTYQINIRNEEEVIAFRAWAEQEMGTGLAVLVNNAGIYTNQPTETMNTKDFCDVVDVNVKGTFFMTRYFVDLMIANYVYEHVEDNTRKVMRYRNVFPQDRVFTWDEVGRFRPSQYLLMHSVIYRTQLLRDCGLELPKHTFYVDNIFVYQPLPYVKTLYYMDLDLYRYFIGRADQSVNESVMAGRIDQQVRVTRHMIDSHDIIALKAVQPKLGRYMFNYLSMMMSISSIFAVIADTPEALGLRTELWEYLRQKNAALYRRCRYKATNVGTNIPGYQGRKLSVGLYRLARKIYKFN